MAEDSKELSGSLSTLDDLPESTFSSRLLALKGEGESESKFALRCNAPLSSMRKYLAGSIPGVDKAAAIAKALGVSLSWLATGQGPMRPGDLSDAERRREDFYLEEAGDPEAAARVKRRIEEHGANVREAGEAARTAAEQGLNAEDVEFVRCMAYAYPGNAELVAGLTSRLSMDTSAAELTQEFALIPGYSVQVSTGPGAFPSAQEKPSRKLAFRRKWLRYRGLAEKDLVLVFAKGDSMEPTISDNNTLMIDTSQRDLSDGSIYVIRTDHHLIAKRVQKLWNKGFLLLSDNREYREQLVEPTEADDLEVIGKVVWIGKDV